MHTLAQPGVDRRSRVAPERQLLPPARQPDIEWLTRLAKLRHTPQPRGPRAGANEAPSPSSLAARKHWRAVLEGSGLHGQARAAREHWGVVRQSVAAAPRGRARAKQAVLDVAGANEAPDPLTQEKRADRGGMRKIRKASRETHGKRWLGRSRPTPLMPSAFDSTLAQAKAEDPLLPLYKVFRRGAGGRALGHLVHADHDGAGEEGEEGEGEEGCTGDPALRRGQGVSGKAGAAATPPTLPLGKAGAGLGRAARVRTHGRDPRAITGKEAAHAPEDDTAVVMRIRRFFNLSTDP